MRIRTYSELLHYHTFEERVKYLQLFGNVGIDTFGFDRVFNQQFYLSNEWKRTRDQIILRDNGCDLAIPGLELIDQKLMIHHINPITIDDIKLATEMMLDPENLILCSFDTHNLIHYGKDIPRKEPVVRKPNDTCPWKI